MYSATRYLINLSPLCGFRVQKQEHASYLLHTAATLHVNVYGVTDAVLRLCNSLVCGGSCALFKTTSWAQHLSSILLGCVSPGANIFPERNDDHLRVSVARRVFDFFRQAVKPSSLVQIDDGDAAVLLATLAFVLPYLWRLGDTAVRSSIGSAVNELFRTDARFKHVALLVLALSEFAGTEVSVTDTNVSVLFAELERKYPLWCTAHSSSNDVLLM